jgi:hypothetical protein
MIEVRGPLKPSVRKLRVANKHMYIFRRAQYHEKPYSSADFSVWHPDCGDARQYALISRRWRKIPAGSRAPINSFSQAIQAPSRSFSHQSASITSRGCT